MQNQIQIFESQEFGKLEVLTIDGKPYFPAKECAEVLGYTKSRNAIERHCKGALKRGVLTNGGMQEKTYIPEGDLYRLIIRSKLPSAIRFETFVFDEVLPTIRRHGAYIHEDILRQMREDRVFADCLLDSLSEAQANNQALMTRVNQLQPKARYFDMILQSPTAVPVSIIAKDYGMTAQAFNKLLHAFGVQYKIGQTWLIYNDFAGRGYTVSKTYHHGDEEVIVHTCWTQKGRLFLYELLAWHGILPDAETMKDVVQITDQDQINEKNVCLIIKGGRLTAQAMALAMRAFLNPDESVAKQFSALNRGEQSVEELMHQGCCPAY
ncbi:MAG: phage antirepressor KilAC domain-containing protein [Oscillospiraceae bacterium]|nr:phage antirepressor KilAC domain-containing protein [Oscillospiraceae bacterium]